MLAILGAESVIPFGLPFGIRQVAFKSFKAVWLAAGTLARGRGAVDFGNINSRRYGIKLRVHGIKVSEPFAVRRDGAKPRNNVRFKRCCVLLGRNLKDAVIAKLERRNALQQVKAFGGLASMTDLIQRHAIALHDIDVSVQSASSMLGVQTCTGTKPPVAAAIRAARPQLGRLPVHSLDTVPWLTPMRRANSACVSFCSIRYWVSCIMCRSMPSKHTECKMQTGQALIFMPKRLWRDGRVGATVSSWTT